MAKKVIELPSVTNSESLPKKWCIQVTSDNATDTIKILDAEVGKRHWLEKVEFTSDTNMTFTILDGNDDFIGAVPVVAGIKWCYQFHREVHGTVNKALKVKTSVSGNIHLIIEGHTDVYVSKASSPTPANEAIDISDDVTLRWSESPQTVESIIYFGAVSPPLLLGSTSDTSYELASLENSTTYYWKINSSDGDNIVEGDIWSFTTKGE